MGPQLNRSQRKECEAERSEDSKVGNSMRTGEVENSAPV
jgi:hypothetical protein